MTQPSISSALRSAARVAEPREDSSGASPYEIAQRYSAGEMTREQTIDELSRWQYVPAPRTDGYDWLTDDPDGTWDEVRRALSDGLLDAEMYTAVQDRIDGLRSAI